MLHLEVLSKNPINFKDKGLALKFGTSINNKIYNFVILLPFYLTIFWNDEFIVFRLPHFSNLENLDVPLWLDYDVLIGPTLALEFAFADVFS